MALTRPTQPPTASLQAAEDWFVFGKWPYSFTSDGPVPPPENPVPEDRYTRYSDLPDAIHRVWRTYGFTGDGASWIIDPVIWEPIVAPWLDGLTFSHMPTDEHFVPLSRGATGEISLLGTTTLNSIDIDPQSGRIAGWNNSRGLPEDYFFVIDQFGVTASFWVDEKSELAQRFGRDILRTTDLEEIRGGRVDAEQFFGQTVPQCEGGGLPRTAEDIAVLPISEIARYGTYPYKRVAEHYAKPVGTEMDELLGLPVGVFSFELTPTAPRNPVLVSGPRN